MEKPAALRDDALQAACRLCEATIAGDAPAPRVDSFFDPVTGTISYVVSDPRSSRCAIIDSVLDFDPAAGRITTGSADRLIAFVQDRALTVEWLLETHPHADHLSAADYLKRRLGGRTAIGKGIADVQDRFGKLFNVDPDGDAFDRCFADGDGFRIGDLSARVLEVPGHTPADVAYVIGDALFVGDTLLMPDRGTARADFPGGDAGQLYRSIRRLYSLPAGARVFVCHDYLADGRDVHAWETSIAGQRADNILARDGVSEAQFVAMRAERDATLAVPRLLIPAIQVNINAGRLPAAEENGIRYLRIPLDAL